MRKYEYLVESVASVLDGSLLPANEALQEWLDAAGGGGWGLVAVANGFLYLRREVSDAK